MLPSSDVPGTRWDAERRGDHLDERLVVGRRRELAEPGAVGTAPASISAATCRARRVLPTPPTPVRVTSRDASQRVGDRGELVARARGTT